MPTLYKYRTWKKPDHKRILTHNEIYFGKPSDFKDNLECNLPIRFNSVDDDDLLSFVVNRFIDVEYYYAERELRQSKFDELFSKRKKDLQDETWQKKEQDRLFDELDELLGVFSVSPHNNNHHLWEVFSGDHEGFCVGFNSDILYRDQENFGSAKKVTYYNPADFLDEEGNPIIILPFYRTYEERRNAYIKNVCSLRNDWKDEDEVRITKLYLKPNEQDDDVIKLPVINRQVIVPKEAYTEVVLGLKMPKEHKNEIAEIVNSRFPHVELLEIDSSTGMPQPFRHT